MKPANQGELLHGPHIYVKRADGSSGYEVRFPGHPGVVPTELAPPLPSGTDLDALMQAVSGKSDLPSAADLDAIAEEIAVREATNGGTE